MANPVIQALLRGTEKSNLLPFFWQHGEDEQTLRHYMRVIHDSGCGAVCVESRPHPDFCGPKWWEDMDVILDEAKKLGMRVWILDDDHFPTGHANGAVDNAPAALCRQSIYSAIHDFAGPAGDITLSAEALATPPVYPMSPMEEAISRMSPPKHRRFDDDVLLAVTAVPVGDAADFAARVDLTPQIAGGMLTWRKPDGGWRVYVTGLSRNYGPHRGHINMMDMDSCRLLIDAVYEPHFARYGAEFGGVIAGFFSDEPELGNGQLYPLGNVLGTPQDLPFSRALGKALAEALGADWAALMPLLWENGADPELTARVRVAYMDAVTRLVERCFSMQLGDWCAAHGVQYIGHVVEDGNQHARTASSLGHFYRGLAGQHMAGIDDIGGQVLPQGEDEPSSGMFGRERDGEFYHYLLGKLASSHAAIDPRKQGRAMCEIFGAYGWGEGVRLEKYLVDHFLVRGVNHYVPHAFSPMAYPDPDCPPHFYAGGHNPQYRHFGALMRYTNRLCQLITDGTRVAPVAILYHAEAEWAGGEYTLCQKPARALMDAQIDFDIIPADVFTDTAQYATRMDGGLTVNTQRYSALVIPEAAYVPQAAREAADALAAKGFPVVRDVAPNDLPAYLRGIGVYDIAIAPASDRLRYLHYRSHGDDLYLFVNEGTQPYTGDIQVRQKGACYAYDAWHNRLMPVSAAPSGDGTRLSVTVDPLASLVIVFGDVGDLQLHTPPSLAGRNIPLTRWTRSTCRGIDYPAFGDAQPVTLPDALAREQPDFSGFARYETTFDMDGDGPAVLEITDAMEGVEVFVNGQSAGIQVVPTFRFDLTGLVRLGENTLAIEVATTLERERFAATTSPMERMRMAEPTGGSGITSTVTLLT